MNKTNEISAKAAEKLGKFATNLATQTVGKSVPWCIHEVKVPEELKKR